MSDYKHDSTILGDKPIYEWAREQEDLARARERKHKALLIERMPERTKNKPFSGTEREQILKGMSLLEIYKRRLRRK